MAFPRRLLRDGEQMVLDLRPHPVAIAFNVLVIVLSVVAAILLLVYIHPGRSGGSVRTWFRWIVAIAAVGVIVFFAIPGIVGWLTEHFVVTSERVISRSGWISKNQKDIPLDRIQNVAFKQSVFERMIGAGDLSLESAGDESDTTFQDVRHPESVQKTIYEAREQDEQRRTQPAQAQQAPAAPAPASSPASEPSGSALPVADELAKLASLRDQGVISDAEFQAQKSRLLGS